MGLYVRSPSPADVRLVTRDAAIKSMPDHGQLRESRDVDGASDAQSPGADVYLRSTGRRARTDIRRLLSRGAASRMCCSRQRGIARGGI